MKFLRLIQLVLMASIGLAVIVPLTLRAADRDPQAKDYSEALSLLAKNVSRPLSEQDVLLVWLLDEGSSMKDDHHAMLKLLPRFYATLAETAAGRPRDSVVSSVVAFGDSSTILLDRPVDRIDAVAAAFRKVPIGESGKENLCRAVGQVVSKYGPHARKAKRRLLIVVATDETASDVELLEQALQVCRREQARVFVLGRPAVLGSGKSFVLWREPVSNRTYRIALQQGVSAAGQELLNWDGIGPLMTVVPDAFGPYPLSRLASETNGLMMQLPMSGFRKPPDYEAAAYAPGLQSRREWEQLIAKSRFRSAIREVVTKLNPHLDKKLSLKQTGYSTELADFRKEAVRESEKVAYAIPLIQRAITLLDDVEVFHDQEGSRRWQANYDLTRAQCHLFQLRLINALIALDGRAVSQTATDGSDDKMLNLAITREVNEPTAEQAPRLQKLLRLSGSPEEFAAELKSQQQEALRLLNSVQANHPRTPWSRVARTELKRGFGVRLLEVVRPPRVKRPIKVPVL